MAKVNPTKLVLAAINPEYSGGIDIKILEEDRRLFKSAIKLAERNGLYYCFISRLKESNLKLPYVDEERWRDEQERLEGLQGTIKLLNNVSRSSGINYIVIKSCNSIPHIPRDVDIFVPVAERAVVISALEGSGMHCLEASEIETSLVKEGCLKVDVYTRICYFGEDFIDGVFLRAHGEAQQVFGIGYPGLDAEADFLLLLVHSLFGHGSMSLLDFLHMRSLYHSIPDVADCRQDAMEWGWGNVFDLAFEEFQTLQERVYSGDTISFPHRFDLGFVLQCVSAIKGLNLSRRSKIAAIVALGLDQLRESQKGSALYNSISSSEPAMRLLRRVVSLVKAGRGDRTSG